MAGYSRHGFHKNFTPIIYDLYAALRQVSLLSNAMSVFHSFSDTHPPFVNRRLLKGVFIVKDFSFRKSEIKAVSALQVQ